MSKLHFPYSVKELSLFSKMSCCNRKNQTILNIQILCFCTLSIILSLSKNTVLLILQNTMFRKLDSVSIFWENLLSWAQSVELVPISVVFCNIKRTVFLHKDRMMDNVQKYNICTNIASSQTFRSYIVNRSNQWPCFKT
jgi:hypothetical protein